MRPAVLVAVMLWLARVMAVGLRMPGIRSLVAVVAGRTAPVPVA